MKLSRRGLFQALAGAPLAVVAAKLPGKEFELTGISQISEPRYNWIEYSNSIRVEWNADYDQHMADELNRCLVREASA